MTDITCVKLSAGGFIYLYPGCLRQLLLCLVVITTLLNLRREKLKILKDECNIKIFFFLVILIIILRQGNGAVWHFETWGMPKIGYLFIYIFYLLLLN